MHHEGRKQAQRRARALAGDDKDAPGLATPPRGDGQDRQPARALIQRGNQPRQPVGSLDQRDPPARPQSTQASVDPCPQRRILGNPRADRGFEAVVLRVEQKGGAACHTGKRSCFFRRLEDGRWEEVGEQVFDPKEVYGR